MINHIRAVRVPAFLGHIGASPSRRVGHIRAVRVLCRVERVWRGKSRGLDPRLLQEVGDLGPSKGLQPIKINDMEH